MPDEITPQNQEPTTNPSDPPVNEGAISQEDLAQFREETQKLINKAVTGLGGRLKSGLQEAIAKTVTEENGQTRELLSQLLAERANQGEAQDQPSSDNDQPLKLEDQVKSLMEWKSAQVEHAKQQATRIQSQEQKIQQLEQVNIELEEKAKAERMRRHWNNISNGRIYAPDQLLTVALASKHLEIKDDQYVIKTDEIEVDGSPKYLTGEQALNELLKLPEYAHFKKTGGGGTGVRADGSFTPPKNSQTIDGIDVDLSANEIATMYAKKFKIIP